MDILSHKLEKSHVKRLASTHKKETLEEKRNLFLITTQNNAIRTNYIEAKTDKT